MLEINSISKSFENRLLFDNISMILNPFEKIAVTGESGCGKTTFLRIILGLEKPDKGSVKNTFLQTSVVFQENRLFEEISVINNLLCVEHNKDKAEYYLEQSGLIDFSKKRTSELSGGMKRRLAVARALFFGGDLFVFDEPLRELDENTEQKMLNLIKQETERSALILVTHNSNHAGLLCDKTLKLGM